MLACTAPTYNATGRLTVGCTCTAARQQLCICDRVARQGVWFAGRMAQHPAFKRVISV